MNTKILAMTTTLICGWMCAVGFAEQGRAGKEAAAGETARPRITGISHLAVYASDMQATEKYYVESIGAVKMADPENKLGARYIIGPAQFVEVLPLPADAGINRLDHTAWNTENAEGLRKYLAARGWSVPAQVTDYPGEGKSFRVKDPEGNVVEFVEPSGKDRAAYKISPRLPGHHIIHVGFMVHSREAEDKFYKELLDFRPYWFGGMQEGKTDWVSQQAPEGHDWLEYMMTSGPSGSGIPAAMSQQALGVLDHLSIGTTSVPEAYKRLASEHRLTGRVDKEAKIGKDGKYQFNLYDPDGIRLELMNFHATDKPCCSPFTAPDPAE